MFSIYDDFLNSMPNSLQLSKLPLFHTTDAISARSILDSKHIEATCEDEWFKGEQTVYLFYGRPAYRGTDDVPCDDMSYSPVCFLFSEIDENQIKRIFPFDSGAWYGKRYSGVFHEAISLESFSLQCSYEALFKHISVIWGSNEQYLYGKAKQLDIVPSDFEIQSLYNLLSGKITKPGFDDRSYSIEVQLHKMLSLTKQFCAIILPNEFRRDHKMQQRIPSSVKRIYYKRKTYSEIKNYYQDIWNEALKYMTNNGFIMEDPVESVNTELEDNVCAEI